MFGFYCEDISRKSVLTCLPMLQVLPCRTAIRPVRPRAEMQRWRPVRIDMPLLRISTSSCENWRPAKAPRRRPRPPMAMFRPQMPLVEVSPFNRAFFRAAPTNWTLVFSPQQQSKSLQGPATAAAQQPCGESIPAAATAAAPAESLWPVDAHTKCLRQQFPAADGAPSPPAAAAATAELLQLQQQRVRHLAGSAQRLRLRQHATRSCDGQQSLCSEYENRPSGLNRQIRKWWQGGNLLEVEKWNKILKNSRYVQFPFWWTSPVTHYLRYIHDTYYSSN